MNREIIHLSFYRFTFMGNQDQLRDHKSAVREMSVHLGLLGTVLMAPEGINAMVAGSPASIDTFKTYIKNRFQLEEKDFKTTQDPNAVAFQRLLVKIKKEIIPIGDSSIQPHRATGQRISATELKQWLDSGKPLILLDTRNTYEVEVGTFKNAQDLSIDCSRDFLQAASERKKSWPQVPIVTFCTGGIRCEKASAALVQLGVEEVFQLDGGILRYFEKFGATHFDGNCFVFDWRMAVDGNLLPVARSTDETKKFGRHQKNK